MKHVLKAFALVAIMFSAFTVQAQKIGHINMQQLVELMPERASAQANLEEFARSLESQSATMRGEYEKLVTEYQNNEQTWAIPIKESKIAAIQDLERRIQEFEAKAQQDLMVKQQDLLQPIIEMATKACEEVAAANGFTYVIDSSAQVLIVYPAEDDLLPLVKKHLNIL